MSSDLDFFGLLFDGIWNAQAQNRQRNGGQTFQMVDGIAPGVATISEAALNAIHPAVAVGSQMTGDMQKALLPINLTENVPGFKDFSEKAKHKTQSMTKVDEKAFQQLYNQILSNKISEYTRTHPGPVPASVRARLQKEALKEAEESAGTHASITLGSQDEPKLQMGLSDFTGFFFNPKGTIDKLTEKAFANKPDKKWQVLMAVSSAVGAGLMLRKMTQNPNIDTKGDAVMMAAVDPHKRAHIFAGALKPGHAISDEQKIKMIFDNALDMAGRAGNFTATTAGGVTRAVVSPEKRVAARYGADAIVEYVKQQRRAGVNVSVDDVINNWSAHSASIQNIMQSDRFIRKVVKKSDRSIYQSALSGPGFFEAVERAWVGPFVSPLRADGRANILARPVLNSLADPRNLLREYSEYKLNRRKWLGRKVTGVHDYHHKLTEIIDGSVQHYAILAEKAGDRDKANTYRQMLQDSKMQARKLTNSEKLYWYKLKWDAYKSRLGPTAGFGLFTGDFFVAAAGAPVVENNLIPKVNIFSGDMFGHIHRHFSTAMPAELTGMLDRARNIRGSNLPPFLVEHSRLSGLAQTLMVGAGYKPGDILKHFGVYKPIPLIPKNANKMQRMSYIIGTVHPYQLVKAFLDGSLGDRLMYIGMRFGNIKDFNQLRGYEKLFLKIGLRLNSSVLYNRFRRFAMGAKFIMNTPTMLLQSGFNLYKAGMKKLAKKFYGWFRRKVVAFWRRIAATRLMRTAVMQIVKKGVEAVVGFITAGASEVFFKIYDAINFITGGALDKLVFKTFLYTMYAFLGLFIILFSGIFTAGAGFSKLLGGHNEVIPAAEVTSTPEINATSNYGHGGGNDCEGDNCGRGILMEGYGVNDIDVGKLQEYAQNGASKANLPPGVVAGSSKGGVAFLSAVGHSLGHAACVVHGCISQMWGGGASGYHQRHQALDIAGNGGATVYALISGTATCLNGKSDNRIHCRDGSYAGDAVMIRGEGKTVYNLHLRCAFKGSWEVKAGDGIGIVATESDGLQSGDCWTGPHLHIHFDPPDGSTLFCTLQKQCGAYHYCNVWGKVNVTCNK